MGIKRVSSNIFKITIILLASVLFFGYAVTITKAEATNYEPVTLTGYIIDEHCFVKKSNDPGKDTKMCKLMDDCVKGGYGIAVKQSDERYKFYYFNGKFFTDTKTLDGTDGQKIAYDLIKASKKEDHLAVTVTGAFSGETKGSIDGTQGVDYKVLDVINLREATDEEEAKLKEETSIQTSVNTMNMDNMKKTEKQGLLSGTVIRYIVIILVILGASIALIIIRRKKKKIVV